MVNLNSTEVVVKIFFLMLGIQMTSEEPKVGVENPSVLFLMNEWIFRANSFLAALQPFLSYNSHSDADILRVNNLFPFHLVIPNNLLNSSLPCFWMSRGDHNFKLLIGIPTSGSIIKWKAYSKYVLFLSKYSWAELASWPHRMSRYLIGRTSGTKKRNVMFPTTFPHCLSDIGSSLNWKEAFYFVLGAKD